MKIVIKNINRDQQRSDDTTRFVWLVDGRVEVLGVIGGRFHSRVGHCITFIVIIFTPNLAGNGTI